MNIQEKRSKEKAATYDMRKYSYPVQTLHWNEKLMRRIVKKLRPKEEEPKILDMGAGTCELMFRLLLDMGLKLTAVDISDAMIAEAKKKQKAWGIKSDSVIYKKADITKPMRRLSNFDAVLFRGTLHHLERKGQIRALKTACELLYKGGKLVLMDMFSPAGGIVKKEFNRINTTKEPADREFLTTEEAVMRLKELGLGGVYVKTRKYCFVVPDWLKKYKNSEEIWRLIRTANPETKKALNLRSGLKALGKDGLGLLIKCFKQHPSNTLRDLRIYSDRLRKPHAPVITIPGSVIVGEKWH